MSLEGLKRGAEIAVNPSYLYGAAKQVWATARPFSEDVLTETDKPNLCLVPGWTCDLGTYHRLTKLLEENFNVLPLRNFPEGLGAIFSRLSIDDQVKLLLQTLENSRQEGIHLLGHSNGGVVAALAQIKAQEKDTKGLIQNVVTLSAPLNGSASISEIPVVSSWARAVSDLHPESAVMQEVREKGEVSDFFVAEKDQLFRPEEMNFPRGVKHGVGHGHFDYMLGKARIVEQTATNVGSALLKT